MSYNHKITDLKFHMDKLVPENVCKYFIKFYNENAVHANKETSYKYDSKKHEYDNFNCINLSQLSRIDNKFKKPFDLARLYISIVITNYVLHIRKNICPTFNDGLINSTSNVRILQYKKGQCIKDHSDVDTLNRASCTLNLNESYKGGEFRFFSGKVKCSFKTGDAMLFPAEPIWIHGTEPITEGVRYAINCFLHQSID